MNKKTLENIKYWKENFKCPEFLYELSKDELNDSFYTKLDFGTAGIRGKLGVGPNRMNVPLVAEATQALALKILKDGNENKGVVIGYDSRYQSKEFAEVSASVLLRNGIKAYLFDRVMATPIVSYSVKSLKTAAGIMITASHNPAEYNGYKLYDSTGVQIDKEYATEIKENMEQLEDYLSIDWSIDLAAVSYVSNALIEEYMSNVKKTAKTPVNDQLSVVYTPLNGVGLEFVSKVTSSLGYTNFHIVEAQKNPDPEFKTTPKPNPEEESVFALAIEEGKKTNADLLIATDPDADRVGVMVKNSENKYEYLDGNAIGAILAMKILKDYIRDNNKKGASEMGNVYIANTIATGPLVEEIAKSIGVNVIKTHVGFKNIYAAANKLNEDDVFLFGYEESLGYGIGNNLAGDKDAISALVKILELAGEVKEKGYTLIDYLNSIYVHYKYESGVTGSLTFEGESGKAKMNDSLAAFKLMKKNPAELKFNSIKKIIDYMEDDTGLPKENVIKVEFIDSSFVIIRPSGTEPKLKLYSYLLSNEEDKSKIKVKEKYDLIANFFQ